MLYELAGEAPEPGSLLESIFVMIAKRRQEAEYYKTKALIAATLADKVEDGGARLSEAIDLYRDSMFPFLSSETTKKDKLSKKLLKQWTNQVLKIRPRWRVQDQRGVISRLRKGAQKVRDDEKKRRKHRHLRLI
jgi:hypothetical protein